MSNTPDVNPEIRRYRNVVVINRLGARQGLPTEWWNSADLVLERSSNQGYFAILKDRYEATPPREEPPPGAYTRTYLNLETIEDDHDPLAVEPDEAEEISFDSNLDQVVEVVQMGGEVEEIRPDEH